ncbi:MAG: hypothetical protein WBQ08_07475 [Candidatus Sulfotelmatobacter sp.]
MHPLDNVIWQALTTRQAHCAEICGEARWFLRDITLLSAFREPSDKGYDSLAELAGPGGTAALFLDEPYCARPGWELIAGPPLLQMIYENGSLPDAPAAGSTILELGEKDSPEMVELATRTKPGPFGTRTHELGTYLGIRRRVSDRISDRVSDKEKLVAMAGERLKIPGHTEVSAVCTHPEHTGRGLCGNPDDRGDAAHHRSRRDAVPAHTGRQRARDRTLPAAGIQNTPAEPPGSAAPQLIRKQFIKAWEQSLEESLRKQLGTRGLGKARLQPLGRARLQPCRKECR